MQRLQPVVTASAFAVAARAANVAVAAPLWHGLVHIRSVGGGSAQLQLYDLFVRRTDHVAAVVAGRATVGRDSRLCQDRGSRVSVGMRRLQPHQRPDARVR